MNNLNNNRMKVTYHSGHAWLHITQYIDEYCTDYIIGSKHYIILVHSLNILNRQGCSAALLDAGITPSKDVFWKNDPFPPRASTSHVYIWCISIWYTFNQKELLRQGGERGQIKKIHFPIEVHVKFLIKWLFLSI